MVNEICMRQFRHCGVDEVRPFVGFLELTFREGAMRSSEHFCGVIRCGGRTWCQPVIPAEIVVVRQCLHVTGLTASHDQVVKVQYFVQARGVQRVSEQSWEFRSKVLR